MMERNNTKKIILSVVGIAIMIVAVIGISFAVYQFTTGTTGTNTINSGTITMSYAEPSTGIELVNALPMSDAAGEAMTGTNASFEFTVSTHASGTLNIPYEINVLPNSDSYGVVDLLADTQVKIYLQKVTGGPTDVVTPVLVSSLGASTKRSGAKVLHSATDVFVNGNSGTTTATTYIMKIWIDEAVDISSISSNPYEYHIKVNVDSTIAAQ